MISKNIEITMTSFSLRVIAGFLICFTITTFAENISRETASEFCPGDKKHYRASVRHIEGGGIGYNQGYTTFDLFLAPRSSWHLLMPFLDLRGHLFDNGKWAANAGTGIRGILRGRTYGLNVFYDYRDTKKIHYNQLGIGLETLGKVCDFRINGYFPFGKKITSPYEMRFDQFSGAEMIISQKHQFAMKGGDAEIGFHFGKSRLFDFYAAAGPYYYIGEISDHIWGGKGRINGVFKDCITLEISDSYDPKFKNNFQTQLSFSFSFGKKFRVKKKECCNSCDVADVLATRMIQSVGREEIIVVGSKKSTL